MIEKYNKKYLNVYEDELENKRNKLSEHGELSVKACVISCGNVPASEVYIRQKQKACAKFGIELHHIHIINPKNKSEVIDEINNALDSKNYNGGIMVQLPIPGFNEDEINEVISSIPSEFDIDGFNTNLYSPLKVFNPIPCTPNGIMKMLKYHSISVEGKNVVIIGRSHIVGKPLSQLMTLNNATVTLCHSKTRNLEKITKTADILVSAVGKPDFIKASMVKDGVIGIDVGINRVNGKLYGDFDYDTVEPISDFLTPVPGGVGRYTVHAFVDNILSIACNNSSKRHKE